MARKSKTPVEQNKFPMTLPFSEQLEPVHEQGPTTLEPQRFSPISALSSMISQKSKKRSSSEADSSQFSSKVIMMTENHRKASHDALHEIASATMAVDDSTVVGEIVQDAIAVHESVVGDEPETAVVVSEPVDAEIDSSVQIMDEETRDEKEADVPEIAAELAKEAEAVEEAAAEVAVAAENSDDAAAIPRDEIAVHDSEPVLDSEPAHEKVPAEEDEKEGSVYETVVAESVIQVEPVSEMSVNVPTTPVKEVFQDATGDQNDEVRCPKKVEYYDANDQVAEELKQVIEQGITAPPSTPEYTTLGKEIKLESPQKLAESAAAEEHVPEKAADNDCKEKCCKSKCRGCCPLKAVCRLGKCLKGAAKRFVDLICPRCLKHSMEQKQFERDMKKLVDPRLSNPRN